MPNTLITDWKKIGQSGPTMDGRTVDPQWLEEAAETYNPATYTAVISIDHSPYYGNMGTVTALKTEKKGSIVSLYAKLQPNDRLLAWNKDGQKLFTSMELAPNFAESGKFYMPGLAVTDRPAQLGTTELHFTPRKQSPDNVIYSGVELDDLEPGSNSEDAETSRLTKIFANALAKCGFNLSPKQGATPEPEEDTMTDEQIAQFAELVGDKVGERLDGLKADIDQKFAALNPDEGTDNGTDAGAAPNEGKQTFSAELGTITSMLDEMKTDFTGKIADLTERFEKANPGTVVPATDQPAPGGKVL